MRSAAACRYDNVESITWDIQKGSVAQAQSLSFKIKLDSRKAQVKFAMPALASSALASA